MEEKQIYLIAMNAIISYKKGELDLIESETEAGVYSLVVHNDKWINKLN